MGVRRKHWKHVLPMTEVKSSGAELPAAMKVAPATSSLSWRRWGRRAEKDGERIIDRKDPLHFSTIQPCSVQERNNKGAHRVTA